MGKPVGKATACLREAASAKAGANLLIEKHGRFYPRWSSLWVRSALSHKISNRPPSEALKSGLPMPARRSGVSARRHGRFCNWRVNGGFIPPIQEEIGVYISGVSASR